MQFTPSIPNLLNGTVGTVGTVGANGAVAGFGDIFAQLLGNLEGASSSQEGKAEGLLAVLSGTGGTDIPKELAQTLFEAVEANAKAGGGELLLTKTDVATLMSRIFEVKEVLATFTEANIDLSALDSVKSLAAAFEQLGDARDVALDKAIRLEEMMALLKRRLGEDGAESFISKLLADKSFLTQTETLVSLTAVTEKVAVAQGAVENILQASVSQEVFTKNIKQAPVLDVVEKVLLGKPLVGMETGKPIVPQAPIKPEIQALLADKPAETAKAEVLAGRDTVRAEVASISGAKGQENTRGKVDIAPTADIKAMLKASRGDRVEPAGRSVSSSERLESPRGVELYKWQQTPTGIDVLSQNKTAVMRVEPMLTPAPVAETPEEILAQLEKGSFMGKLDEGARSDTRIPFSEKLLNQARANHATQQVTVQMKQLLAKGGGTVRIQLSPVELGKIDIELEIKDGRVQGILAAERPEVLAQMARDLQHLKQGLADAGFSLGEDGMSLLLTQDERGQDDQRLAKDNSQNSDETADAENDTHHAPERWVAPDRLLDVSV